MKKIQILVGVVVGTLNISLVSHAACFNFDQPIKAPLRKPKPFKKGNKDLTASGKTEDHSIWGAARGMVKKPIQNLYTQLLDHYTIKSKERVKLRVYNQDRQGFQDYHVVMVALKTPLGSVDWEEEWGYVVTEGTPQKPKTVVISYQKTNGSKFIPHLCGSIVLNAVDAKDTDVYLYEEINALGKRSPEDTVKGHKGTLIALRNPNPETATAK